MMKKLMAVCLAVLLLSLSAPALAENEPRLIRVSGSAAVSLAADTATLQIGVNTKKPTVMEAQKENAALMNAVLDALHELGIEDQDIVTSQFNVSSQYDYSVSSFGQETRTLYYDVQNNVSVTVHDLTLIGQVLDAAMEAGANTSYGITFSSTKENEAYQKALTRAVEDAMQKASVLAAAAKVQLGELMSINATQNQYTLGGYGVSNTYAYEAKAMDRGTVITSGDITVSADVVLEYAFQ
ncbi:MAG: SIMPL domain-containing protein [Clostridia bacterium]|nr:SIMPL domain-containing protein [Clostridia bacterium]